MFKQKRLQIGIILWGIILFFVTNSTFGQENYHGNLKDIETGKNISSATIVFDDGKGVISDQQGNFKIEDAVFPMKLEISHLGYHPKSIIIKSIYESGIVIPLEPLSININQVEIVGERIQRLFPKTYFYLIDYAFVDDKILIIGYDQSRLNHGKLFLTNLSQDTLSSLTIEKPKKLYHDGFGNIHLFAGDSVYQLFIEGDEVLFLYPTKAIDFPEDLLKLQFQISNHFFFKELGGEGGQANIYYAIDTVNKNKIPLRTVFQTDLFKSEQEARGYRQWAPIWILKMDTLLSVVLGARRSMEKYVYDINVIHKPINSRIFKVGNRAVIVDLANKKTIQFDQNLEEVSSVKNKFPQHHKVQKLIIQDQITGKLYWVNYVGTKVSLLELDINTGKVKTTLETPNLPFIENIQIRDGVIWFLYQPRLGETVRSLYRMNK